MTATTPDLVQRNDCWVAHFTAMACPCEILLVTSELSVASRAADIACQEALRIERKFSRYRNDNIIHQINNSEGTAVEVDEETSHMLDFAQQCFELSEGKFDITSGALRKIWKFDGSDNIPDDEDIASILPYIGWQKVSWNKPYIKLPEGMEIDLGGIGKEYAVDQSAKLIAQSFDIPFLVNYGGDIFANRPRHKNAPWIIGVDDPQHTGEKAIGEVQLYQGGLATSGDARRFLFKDGVRYSHILDPLTGWPVPRAPHSVTVIADTCLEAGMLSTFAMLQGDQAQAFLETQKVKFWCA